MKKENLTISGLLKKTYLNEHECISLLNCFYPKRILREYLRADKLKLRTYHIGVIKMYRCDSVMKFYNTLRYEKKWKATYAAFLPE